MSSKDYNRQSINQATETSGVRGNRTVKASSVTLLVQACGQGRSEMVGMGSVQGLAEVVTHGASGCCTGISQLAYIP
jgi:hypothetical protein